MGQISPYQVLISQINENSSGILFLFISRKKLFKNIHHNLILQGPINTGIKRLIHMKAERSLASPLVLFRMQAMTALKTLSLNFVTFLAWIFGFGGFKVRKK